MSLLERVHAYDGQEIERGKRLIRAGRCAGLLVVERISTPSTGCSPAPSPIYVAACDCAAASADAARLCRRTRFAGDKATGEALLHGYLVVAGHNHPIEKPGLQPIRAFHAGPVDYLPRLRLAA
jgi:hypothetical protein